MKLTLIAGARPNFMKLAPLVAALQAAGNRPRIVHTGQHYDEKMSETFFRELNIPRPDCNLEVGSASHVFQIAEVMRRLEEDLLAHRPDAVVVVGDVNSTLSAAIAAQKTGIRVAHVEAGLRSNDRDMPEEINRVLTDAISDWLFTSEAGARDNLHREGIPDERIHFVGNVMIDTLLAQLPQARNLRYYESLKLAPGTYQVVTLHRPSNVDNPERLKSILAALQTLNERLATVFVVHPRTRKRIEEFGLAAGIVAGGFRMIEPLGYTAMLSLVDSARLVLTDSGGLQEETTALGVPCLTLRENTERPITIEHGTNALVGWKTSAILEGAAEALVETATAKRVPEKWDGKAAVRIVDVLSAEIDGKSRGSSETRSE